MRQIFTDCKTPKGEKSCKRGHGKGISCAGSCSTTREWAGSVDLNDVGLMVAIRDRGEVKCQLFAVLTVVAAEVALRLDRQQLCVVLLAASGPKRALARVVEVFARLDLDRTPH